MSISFEERKKVIMETLARDEIIHVPTLAEVLHVSSETIRRDLDRLEQEGKLRKVYGGAVKASPFPGEPSFDQKAKINAKEKEAISRTAASLVENGDTIFVGVGTTPLEFIRHLGDKHHVTLITPSIPVMLLAMEHFHGNLIFIGGEINVTQKIAQGPLAEWTATQIKAHKAFISAGGISLSDGITDFDLQQANMSRILISRAESVIVLADYTKVGQTTFAHICPLSAVSTLVTDWNCPQEWRRNLRRQGINLLIANPLQ